MIVVDEMLFGLAIFRLFRESSAGLYDCRDTFVEMIRQPSMSMYMHFQNLGTISRRVIKPEWNLVGVAAFDQIDWLAPIANDAPVCIRMIAFLSQELFVSTTTRHRKEECWQYPFEFLYGVLVRRQRDPFCY
jgi:hypothetical protein